MANWTLTVTVQRHGRILFSAHFGHLPITIGAATGNDIVLDDPLVSGQHARVILSRGAPLFLDQSRNGSFVRGHRVAQHPLAPGDHVEIPPFSLDFALAISDGHNETRAAAPAGASIPAPSPEPPRPPAPEPVPRLALQVIRGPQELRGRILPLPGATVTLGRGHAADIRIPLATVSRLHLELTTQAHGELALRDLNSANGTVVGGQRVMTAQLTRGSQIEIGHDLVLLVVDSPHLAASPGSSEGASRSALRPWPASQPAHGASQPPVVDVRGRRATGDPRVLVLEISGRVDGYTYSVVGEALERRIDGGERFIVVDLRGVTFIDHAGLGVLVKALVVLEERKGRLHLVGLGPRLRNAFALSRLDALFRHCLAADEAGAVAALARHLEP
jgi:anti-sigma B factor antagonist